MIRGQVLHNLLFVCIIMSICSLQRHAGHPEPGGPLQQAAAAQDGQVLRRDPGGHAAEGLSARKPHEEGSTDAISQPAEEEGLAKVQEAED